MNKLLTIERLGEKMHEEQNIQHPKDMEIAKRLESARQMARIRKVWAPRMAKHFDKQGNWKPLWKVF